eukprot:tig00000640_g2756.t1
MTGWSPTAWRRRYRPASESLTPFRPRRSISFHCDYEKLGLQKGTLISVTGSPACLGAWEVEKSIPISEHGGLFIHISRDLLPFEFKFVIRGLGDEGKILWQKGGNYTISADIPTRFDIDVEFYLGEVTTHDKKPVTFNDYSWQHYAWALTNQNRTRVTVEGDHMYLDPSCRLRRLLDDALRMLEGSMTPDCGEVDDAEYKRLCKRLAELLAQISMLRDAVPRGAGREAADAADAFVEQVAALYGLSVATGGLGGAPAGEPGSPAGARAVSFRQSGSTRSLAVPKNGSMHARSSLRPQQLCYNLVWDRPGSESEGVSGIPWEVTQISSPGEAPVGESRSFRVEARAGKQDRHPLASSATGLLRIPEAPGVNTASRLPSAPQCLRAAATSSLGNVPAAVSLEWAAPVHAGSSPIKSYELMCNNMVIATVPAGERPMYVATAPSLPRAAPAPAAPYTFTVAARNSDGVGESSLPALCYPADGAGDGSAIPMALFFDAARRPVVAWGLHGAAVEWADRDTSEDPSEEARMRRARRMGEFVKLSKMVPGKDAVVAVLLALRDAYARIRELEGECERLRQRLAEEVAENEKLRAEIQKKLKEIAELLMKVQDLERQLADCARPGMPRSLEASEVAPTSCRLSWLGPDRDFVSVPGGDTAPPPPPPPPPPAPGPGPAHPPAGVQGDAAGGKGGRGVGPLALLPHSFKVEGLAPGEHAAFAVRAVSARGEGPATLPLSVSTPLHPLPPAPGGLRCLDQGYTSASVAWDAGRPLDGAAAAAAGGGASDQGYNVYLDGRAAARTDPGVCKARLTGIDPKAPHVVTVAALGPHGEGPKSAPLAIYTGAIGGSVYSLKAAQDGMRGVKLTWKLPAVLLDSGIESFDVLCDGAKVANVQVPPPLPATREVALEHLHTSFKSGESRAFTVSPLPAGTGPASNPVIVLAIGVESDGAIVVGVVDLDQRSALTDRAPFLPPRPRAIFADDDEDTEDLFGCVASKKKKEKEAARAAEAARARPEGNGEPLLSPRSWLKLFS